MKGLPAGPPASQIIVCNSLVLRSADSPTLAHRLELSQLPAAMTALRRFVLQHSWLRLGSDQCQR